MRYVLYLALIGNVWFLLMGAYVGLTETFDYSFWNQYLHIDESAVAENVNRPEALEGADLAPVEANVRPWNGKKDSSQVLNVVGQMMVRVKKTDKDSWKRLIAEIRECEESSDPKTLTNLVKTFPKAPRQLKKLYQDVQAKCDSRLIEREPMSEEEIPEEILNCKASLKNFERALSEFYKAE